MKLITKIVAGFAVLVALSTSSFAGPGVIAQFNVDDIALDPTSIYFGTKIAEPPVWAHDPTVTVSKFTLHGGLTLKGGNMTYNNWDTTINPNKYLGFTVTPNPGVPMVLTSLNYTPSETVVGATYYWAYRIDNGSGFGPWTNGPTFVGGANLTTWTFPTPIQTTGAVEFGFFASAPTAASSATPGAPVLYGTAGDTSPDPSLVGVISKYTDSTAYLGAPDEASAITYDWDRKTLLLIGDEGPAIYEYSKTGTLLSSMTMTKPKFADGQKGDPEGLSYLGKGSDGVGRVMIAAERENVAIQTTYRPNGIDSPDWFKNTPIAVFGPINNNLGLEGLSADTTDGSLWGVNEHAPVALSHATNLGTPQQTVTSVDINDLKWRLGTVSLSDVFVMANSAAYANSDHLLVLARDDRKLIEITKTGKVVDVLSLANLGRGTIEGLTMDDDGVVYLCAEKGSISGDPRNTTPAIFVLKRMNPVQGSGGRQTLGGGAGADIIYGNPAADTLTGGTGADVFVFKTLRDGIDTITDFTPGVDTIDLTAVLASIGFKGTTYTFTPLADGVVRVIDGPTGAVVQILSGGSYRSLAVLNGVTAARANAASNFRFISVTLN
jgi:uncharacterized protein YjiK